MIKETDICQEGFVLGRQQILNISIDRLFFVIIVFLLCTGSFSEAKEAEGEAAKVFSRAEYRWAIKWINNELSVFMEKGIIKKIIAKEHLFEVQVGEPWHELDFDQQGIFLRDLSRSREITGHPPFFDVKDFKTNAIAAKVSESAIEIFLPGIGLLPYFPPEDEQQKHTFY